MLQKKRFLIPYIKFEISISFKININNVFLKCTVPDHIPSKQVSHTMPLESQLLLSFNQNEISNQSWLAILYFKMVEGTPNSLGLHNLKYQDLDWSRWFRFSNKWKVYSKTLTHVVERPGWENNFYYQIYYHKLHSNSFSKEIQ